MRILLLSHGPSTHTRRWARALSDRGHSLLLLTTHAAADPGVPARVVGTSWLPPSLRTLSALGAVRREIRVFQPDVTVAHFLPNYGWLAAIAGARPWALTCWGSDLLINARRSPLHRARARFVLGRADLIHVDAAVLAEAATRLGAPPGRVWTRAWGVEDAAIAPAILPRGSDRAAPVRILWTRQLEPVYDPDTFIGALVLLKRRGMPFRAMMAGDGTLRARIEARIEREGLSREIALEGFVGCGRLRELMRESDVYVSLSRSDSTSQSLLEAMAAGLFPIVSDIAGNREWVTHRREGYLVPVGDREAVACAIEEAQRDPDSFDIRSRALDAIRSRGRFAEMLELLESKLKALAS